MEIGKKQWVAVHTKDVTLGNWVENDDSTIVASQIKNPVDATLMALAPALLSALGNTFSELPKEWHTQTQDDHVILRIHESLVHDAINVLRAVRYGSEG